MRIAPPARPAGAMMKSEINILCLGDVVGKGLITVLPACTHCPIATRGQPGGCSACAHPPTRSGRWMVSGHAASRCMRCNRQQHDTAQLSAAAKRGCRWVDGNRYRDRRHRQGKACHSGPIACHTGPRTCHTGPEACHSGPIFCCFGRMFRIFQDIQAV